MALDTKQQGPPSDQSSPAAERIIVVGRLFVDLVFSEMEAFPELGKEYFAKGLSLTVGGGALTTSAWLHHLGHEPGIVSEVSNDLFGTFVLDWLAKRGLAHDHIHRTRDCTPQLTVALPFNGDRAFMTRLADLENEPLPSETLRNMTGTHLHIAEYATLHRDPGLIGVARKKGMTISLDCAWDDALLASESPRALLQNLDLFLPNYEEAVALLDASQNGVPAPDAAKALAKKLNTLVVVKCGANGVVASGGAKTMVQNAFPVKTVDTTGAGDAFVAGFLARYLNGADLASALRLGAACGAMACMAPGGAETMPAVDRVYALCGEHGQ